LHDIIPARRAVGRASVARQHARELDRIDRQADLHEAEIEAIGSITERAIIRTAMVQRTRAAAEHLAPDGAELYALLSIAGATQMGQVIRRAGRR
jgi:hypothetical protein